jgi:flagellin-like protein
MGLFQNKRAVSPLVATVLLIAFSVALGAVVMSWGESYIEQKAPFVQGGTEVGGACGSSSLSIIKVKDVPQVCARGDELDIFVRNGDVQIQGIKALIVGSDGVAVVENILETPLKPDDAVKTTVAHQPVGTVQQLTLTPVVESGGTQEFCRQSETKVEDIHTC